MARPVTKTTVGKKMAGYSWLTIHTNCSH